MKLKLCGSNDRMLNSKNWIDISNQFDLNLSKEINNSKHTKCSGKELNSKNLELATKTSEKCEGNRKTHDKQHKRINYKTFIEYLENPSKNYECDSVNNKSIFSCVLLLFETQISILGILIFDNHSQTNIDFSDAEVIKKMRERLKTSNDIKSKVWIDNLKRKVIFIV